ncbi:DMT family transporter [Jannaschia rubra]|uniref:Putative chloramphenical resistance permease RarD n=2 Tax=Jannaschia rubra TaxID=282197 RepID=A0A0M6XNJ3_9RHOB|nr:DMT family transporter [Jannaschia rubra]CTQ32649.1 putative chloramphenical resistance permease RarD [Jannaschia rubra]SFF86719.1 EamA domain-containing membrane protein RarD [Jannaschia rubra]
MGAFSLVVLAPGLPERGGPRNLRSMVASSPAPTSGSTASGVGLRLAAVGFATGLGFCIHGAADHARTGQIVFLRSALSIPFLLVWAAAMAPVADWRPRAPRKHLVRGVAGGLSMVLNFYALGQLPVSNAQALSYLAPVLSIPAAVILLGERLSRRTVIAVALGFAGMIAMLYTAIDRPGWGLGQLTGVMAGIASAGIMALVRVHIKAMTATETTISIALSFAVVTTCLGAVAVAVTGWVPMTPVLWAWMLGAGALGAATHVTATAAVARAPVSTLAPFDYAGLVFAVVLEFALYSVLPGPWGWLGIGLIMAAGLLTAWTGRPIAAGLRLR